MYKPFGFKPFELYSSLLIETSIQICRYCIPIVMKNSLSYLCGAAQVIVINLLNCLKVNEPFQLGLMLVYEEKKKKKGGKKNKTN